MNTDVARLTLEMSFPDGTGNLTVTDEHPLVAVFRRAVRTGNYSGTWVYLIARPAPSEKPKMLGTIAWTPGKRFLYFPGRKGTVTSVQGDLLNDRDLDHVTLELDRATRRFSEHIAVQGNGEKSRGRTRSGVVGSRRLHPWFSLILPDLSRYEDLPANFCFDLPMPSSDIGRRCRAMMGSGKRTDVAFPIPRDQGAHYYQLDVWAGRGHQWKERYADALPWPAVPGVIESHQNETCEKIAQRHELDECTGFVTVLTRPSGTALTTGILHPDVADAPGGSESAVVESCAEPESE